MNKRPLFKVLREWRGELSKKEGISPYIICTNIQLAKLAVMRVPFELKQEFIRPKVNEILEYLELDRIILLLGECIPGIPGGNNCF